MMTIIYFIYMVGLANNNNNNNNVPTNNEGNEPRSQPLQRNDQFSLSLFLHIRIAAVNAEESEEKATTATAHIAYAYTQTDYIDTCVHYGIVDILYSYVT